MSTKMAYLLRSLINKNVKRSAWNRKDFAIPIMIAHLYTFLWYEWAILWQTQKEEINKI